LRNVEMENKCELGLHCKSAEVASLFLELAMHPFQGK